MEEPSNAEGQRICESEEPLFQVCLPFMMVLLISPVNGASGQYMVSAHPL